MKHTFNLVSPGKDYSTVRLIVSHDGEKFRKSVGVTVKTSLWNQKGRTPDKMCKDRSAWEVIGPIHAKLVEKEVTARKRRDVLDAISYAFGEDEKPTQRPLFWAYFKDWSERDTPSRRFRELAYKRISALMGTDDDWEDIDGDWYFRFVRECDGLQYSHNYKSTLTAKLKSVMNEGFKRGFHKNEEFRKFVTSYKTADTIALTQAEVDALWDAELTGRQAMVRDCFIVGVYCAGRFQDYSQLSKENISEDGRLHYTQRKTGRSVVIPTSPRILQVFDRNGGRCPKITEQEVGRHIKTICKDIGGSFNDVVEIRSVKGGKIEIQKKHRHELISCHTARRSSISILHRSGVPLFQLMSISGHRTIQNLQKYIKGDKSLDYDLLKKVDFFQ